jgi:hypothetical protein
MLQKKKQSGFYDNVFNIIFHSEFSNFDLIEDLRLLVLNINAKDVKNDSLSELYFSFYYK